MNRERFSPRRIVKAAALATAVTLAGTGCVEVKPAPTHVDPAPDPTTIFEPVPPVITPEITTSPEKEKSEPNIFVFMMDDISVHDEWLFSEERMPNIYAIFIENSIKFTNFNVEVPLCCPARAGYYTGQYAQNHGVLNNTGGYPQKFDPSVTLATELQEKGHRTMISGKYSNAFNRLEDQTPQGWNYQAIPNLMNAGPSFGWTAVKRDGYEYHGFANEDYSTDVFADYAIEYMRLVPKDKPIFALIAPYATHGPFTPAPRHRDDPRCDNLPPVIVPGYNTAHRNDPEYMRRAPSLPEDGIDMEGQCRTLLAVDDLVGRVVSELEREGRLENTILVLTSDHGMNRGYKKMTGKETPNATDTPLWINPADNMWQGEGTADAVISNIDLPVTLAQAAGVRLGPFPNGQRTPDGISFYEVLFDPEVDPNIEAGREYILIQEPVSNGIIPAWYGVEATRIDPLGQRFLFARYETGEEELYNLVNDPNKINNIAYDENFQEEGDILLKEAKLLLKPA